MKITPLEIKRQQFKKGMRGYDTVEVETFLEMLSNEVEQLLKENKDMMAKIEVEVRKKLGIGATDKPQPVASPEPVNGHGKSPVPMPVAARR